MLTGLLKRYRRLWRATPDLKTIEMGVTTRQQAAITLTRAPVKARKLPVTLLSGFLGAGKTTLLQHVLRNKEDLKCAIIVNDMAEINIDANLIKSGSLVQAEEKLVEMQNGCICCTLREDLIQEVGKLAAQGCFDYLIIESTGISEPMQVAETFDMPMSGKALKDIAQLDTCVTVVDASNLFLNLASIQKVKEQEDAKKDVDNDERNIADLLIDQIEFADVIILNKTDLVSKSQLMESQAFIRTLNPGANLLSTMSSKVPLQDVVGTKRFDLDKAQRSAGWLQSLLKDGPIVPESEEYGISSFVYRSRVPFHPMRLWDFVNSYFAVEQPEIQMHDPDEDSGACDHDMGACIEADAAYEKNMAIDATEVASKQSLFHEKFGQVFRAKGFFWLAGRDSIGGEWSQAGAMLRLSMGAPWFAALPKEAWPDVDEAEVMKDFKGESGDRRQELVFIGQNVHQGALTASLDACLCTEIERLEVDQLEDPFMTWPEFKLEYEEMTDDEGVASGDEEDEVATNEE